MNKDRNVVKIINNILRVVIIVTIIIKIILSNYENILMLFVIFGLTFYDYFIRKLFKIELSEKAKIMVSIFIFLAPYLGSVMKFYDVFSWWDILLHFLSGIVGYFIGKDFLISISNKDKKVKLNYAIVSIFAICFTLAIGNIWEIIEFVTDGITGGDTQRAAGLVGRTAVMDTMEDLISSTVGLILTFTINYYFYKKKNIK